MTKYDGGEGLNMNPEQKPQHGVFPSSLNEKGSGTFGITTTPPLPETGKHYGDERDKVFEPPARTAPPERPKFWDKEPVRESLIQRMVNNLYLRLVLAGAGTYGAGYAANEVYQNVPAVHRETDNVLERFGLKVVVPPTFDNKAEETVLGRNNSFYVTPEEYKEKGPPTVEGNRVNVPFFIRFNDGREHIVSVKRPYSGSWEISGDIQGGEVLVPARENGEILGGGGSEGMPYLYKPGMSFSRFSSWQISLADGEGKGGKIYFIITTGALQTAKDLVLQRDKRGIDRGPVRGFASIGTLLDNQPVVITSNTITPENKFNGARTDIATIPAGQAYVLR